jgi:spermidine synthase
VKPDTKIRSFNLDGRQFIAELSEKEAYDVVVQDAVNDLSVPYHLLTLEYDRMVKQVMRPDGVYLLSIIDDVPRGGLLRSAIRTMREVFPHVAVLHDVSTGGKGQSIYMVAGSAQPFVVEKVRAAARAAGVEEPRTAALSQEAIEQYLAYGPAVLLTDEFAPVDNLLAQLFLLREEVGDRSVLADKKPLKEQ